MDSRTRLGLGRKLKKYLRSGRIRFPGKTCPFLTEGKLCELVLSLGEDGIGKTCKRYPRHRRREFLREYPEGEIFVLRVFEYFLYSFGLTALYDGDFCGKIKMAAAYVMAAEDFLMAAGDPSLKTQAGVFHLFARQIENSRENLGRLERMMRGRNKN